MIELKNVHKVFKLPHNRKRTLRQHFVSIFNENTYEDFYALKDISITIKKGEFFGIIGKNGSGKSTLLKIIAKVLEPSSGTVVVNGLVAPFLELGVGFQGDLSVRDNVYLYGAMLGMTRSDVKRKYNSIIEFAELENFVDAKLKNLSSGMQVRLGFSITVTVDSPILLVDEVLAVGDIDFQKKCYDSFESFKHQGKTIVFVSHDLDAVQQFCDRVLLLQKGVSTMTDTAVNVLNLYRK